VISLRIPNCFGPHQPFDGEDVGLVGNFIRDLLGHKTIDLFRGNRWRTILYVKDLAQVVFRLSQKPSRGFRPFVLAGIRIRIEQLVKTLIRTMGIGSYTIKAMPKKIKAIEMGNAVVDDSELKVFIGGIQTTDLVTGLKQTINYFRDRYRDQTV
jgi:nucleoside-diphosphate-sugar epimerase